MNLDARSLLVIGGFLCWILAAAIEFQAVRPNTGRVLPDAWTLGLLAKGMGLILISQRGFIADVWSISLAHALLLASLLFFYAALQKIRGFPTSRLMIAVIPVSLAIVLPIIGFTQEAFPMRVLVITSAWVFGFSLSCWSAVQIARAGYVAGASLILGSSVVLAVLAVAFALAVINKQVPGVFGGSAVQLAFYGINDICIALGTFGYMDIVRIARNQLRQLDGPMHPDSLTGLYSREAFMKSSLQELRRAQRRDYSIAVMMIQIDSFEVIAAAKGRAFIERALKRVAATIHRNIRMYDFAGRLSDGLIGVVMPELPLPKGAAVAERIRAAVAEDGAVQNGDDGVTISVGLCESRTAQQNVEEVMAVAAACLDRARLEGGNRVVTLEGGDHVDTPAAPPSKNFMDTV